MALTKVRAGTQHGEGICEHLVTGADGNPNHLMEIDWDNMRTRYDGGEWKSIYEIINMYWLMEGGRE
tara:strand:- start:6601 stop:6801 length:201 start_codon:yes stop_codon:yes gene_type:complete